MENATYMAGVIITICIVTAIIITIIAAVLIKKVNELDLKVHDLSLKLARTVGIVEGLHGVEVA